MKHGSIIVLDVGTTGVKAFIFNEKNQLIQKSYATLSKQRPKRGWVEQNPKELLEQSIFVLRDAISQANIKQDEIIACGITNQRETIIAWDKKSGKHLYSAIVWEDARTTRFCNDLKQKNGEIIRQKTGLKLEPYGSASKIKWMIDNVSEIKKCNDVAFGTVDSWLAWNICANHPHTTDQTNASRTLLYNIKSCSWDNELLRIFGVNKKSLPIIQQSSSLFGFLDAKILGNKIPLLALCGDQQSSMVAAGTKIGSTKITFGTGAFIMQSLGSKFELFDSFYTTLIPDSCPTYALEAKVENCGVRVSSALNNPKQLRNVLKTIAKQTAKLLRKLPIQPKEITIDGGVTRDGIIAECLTKETGMKIKTLQIFDGTALGTAILVRSGLNLL